MRPKASSIFVRRGLPLLTFLIAANARAQDVEIRAMTFNLRYASDAAPNRWSDRRERMKKTILDEDPDIIGTQEGLYRQLRDIAEDLKDYEWIGEGRNGGSAGEFMAIFYKRDRFDPQAYGHFWLSDTPDTVGSFQWGNNLPRMVTWVRFREIKSEREFLFWNTHFDHQSQPAREKSADLVIQRIRALTPRLPLILTGDFNAAQDLEVYKKLLTPVETQMNLRDTWLIADKRENEGYSTFNGFREPDMLGRRIDWILVSDDFECDLARIVTAKTVAEFPSDHFPVIARLRLRPPTPPPAPAPATQ